MDYCNVLINYSLVSYSHYDGTHSLQRIQSWTGDVTQNFSIVFSQENGWHEGDFSSFLGYLFFLSI